MNGSTSTPAARWSDRQVAQFIARVLQAGVFAAALVGVLGGAMLIASQGGQSADFSVYRGQPEELRSLSGIARGVGALDPYAIIQLGLVLLVATPITRVALTLVAFLIQRDRLYVAMTALVLALLLAGLL